MALVTMKSNLAQGAGIPLGSPEGRHTEGVDVANTMSIGARVGTDTTLISATPEKTLAQITSNQKLKGRHTKGNKIISPFAEAAAKKTLIVKQEKEF